MDIGFWELFVVGVVALLLIGPERLPEVARTLGRWVGRAKSYLNTVKADVDREMRLQELQDMMKLNERNSRFEVLEEAKAGLESIVPPPKPAEASAPPVEPPKV